MKILLLGEYSGLHKNLKEGLIELGHEVVTASSGDGYKRISSDINLDSNLPFGLDRIFRRINPLLKLSQFSGYDIVQLMNPFIFYHKLFPWSYFYNQIKNNNKKLYMLAAGDDAYYWRAGRANLEYGPFADFLKYDLNARSYFMESESALRFNNYVIELVDGIIPIAYDYEIGYKKNAKLLNTIPIPINTNKVKFKENKLSGKLVVFHGLNRYGFKGTRHVEVAFEYLRKKYPNDLELVIDGQMPLDKYLNLMDRANVVIDQMYAYSLGVNGVYAMAMGKIVMGGGEPESLISLGVESTPVINLKPDSQSIIIEVEKLLSNREKIVEIGYESRRFAENTHGHIVVAEKYINTWR